ncbi:hypothetical protein N9C66_09060 [Akkermansiaceae bacterium]|nr:hypothetical protein [Akkermansiaceae bacterium]
MNRIVLFGAGMVGATFADESVVREILPSKEESAWLEIDWKTDLWEARKEAAQSGKPIYLWEMDGHPLGCV